MTTMKKFALLTAAIALGAAGNAMATGLNYQYIQGAASNLDWNTPAYWKPLNGGTTYPQAGDTAIFDRGETVSFATNVPTALAEIRVNHASENVTLVPGSGVTAAYDKLDVSAGQLTLGANLTTTVNSDLDTANGTALNINGPLTFSATGAGHTINGNVTFSAASTISGQLAIASTSTYTVAANMDISGTLDCFATFNTSSNPTITVTGIMKLEAVSMNIVSGTPSLINNGDIRAIDGSCNLPAALVISDNSAAIWRVQQVTSGSPVMQFNAAYTGGSALNGIFRVEDTSSQFNFQNNLTAGNFYSAYGSPCSGKAGPGTFTWVNSVYVPAGNCP